MPEDYAFTKAKLLKTRLKKPRTKEFRAEIDRVRSSSAKDSNRLLRATGEEAAQLHGCLVKIGI